MTGNDPRVDLEELLNPDEQQQFRRLCMETSPEELAQLVEIVELHLTQIREVDTGSADLETADKIGAALVGLLSSGTEFDAEQRSLIRGAVEYFLLADDAADDLSDALGFDDDARVVNSMLARIGQDRFQIDLS